MARPRKKRVLSKKCVVYCEGQTEQNYLDGFKRWVHSIDPSSEITIKPVDVGGGGYASMLRKVQTEPDSNCVARIVLLDFDRYLTDPDERNCLPRLIEVSKASIKKKVPIILILSNKKFEYVLCCHDDDYNHGDVDRFIRSKWNQDPSSCKGDANIWEFCNRGGRSIEIAMKKLSERSFLVKNGISFASGKPSPILLSTVEFNADAEASQSSNFGDLVRIGLLDQVL